MNFFEPLLIFILVRYIRKTLRQAGTYPEWHKKLLYVMIAIPVLYVFGESNDQQHFVSWFWHLSLLGIVGFIYKRPEFAKLRNLVLAVIPLIIVGFLHEISAFFPSRISRTVDTYLDYANPFIIVWILTMLVIYTRQQKTLDKEKKKREDEEKLFRITASQKQQLEVMVAERTAELTTQKDELEHALSDLKVTQNQLVQAEKMASLGELTAGIAHEIQNPLNFVNNFSEVNTELIDELTTAFNKGDKEEVMAIAHDIKMNLEKITHHGKRADAIVKGMLQHSQNNSGLKEPADLNLLADEYMGLSYHGLRAKDKMFNATLKKNFDPTLGQMELIPQDIGRVLLNIYNNAFYAVNEKKKMNIPAYEPNVVVSTKKLGNRVELKIRDNGNGIPEKVLDKIFQPFFTTKPTGQGTGLGLSLSYDIVTKGHAGTMAVDTKEGEYTEFIIQLPLN